MAHDDDTTQNILETHPDGSTAVQHHRPGSDRPYFDAIDPNGLCLGVYDKDYHARSAAHWGREFLLERPDLPRMALMQLIIDKLRVQYPDDTAEAVLGPTGE